MSDHLCTKCATPGTSKYCCRCGYETSPLRPQFMAQEIGPATPHDPLERAVGEPIHYWRDRVG